MNTSTYDPRTGTINCYSGNIWFVPEEKLNTEQKQFFSSTNFTQENIWIKGIAGTGKSLLLVHTAKQILAREPRARILFVVFTKSLVEMFKTALCEVKPPLQVLPNVETYLSFMSSCYSYDYILCDEVQDLTPRILDAMSQRAKHIIVAGDSSQSIYREDPRWRERTLEAEQIIPLLRGRDYFLPVVERFSETIINAVKTFIPINIFAGARSISNHDTKIYLYKAQSLQSEISAISRQAMIAAQRGYTTAILIPTQKKIVDFINQVLLSRGVPEWTIQTNRYNKPDFGLMNRYLQSCGVNIQYIGNSYGTFDRVNNTVILMTYHSAKGLDFDFVYLPFCNDNLWLSYDLEITRRLFMVAITRVRMNLNISYTGNLYQYVRAFANLCTQRTI